MRVLILGGTGEANALAARLAERADIAATLSLAGRTQAPAQAAIPTRIGGFGGVEGLRAYLAAERVEAVVDATHPFAAQMAAHAAQACDAARVPLLRLGRPPWARRDGDHWIDVATMTEAAAALGAEPRRVFLTQGRQQLAAFAMAPQHFYLVRAIEQPDHLVALPRHKLILARGPFAVEDEEALMRAESIELVVSKNSGGAATYAKIEAARRLGLPVVMVSPPARPAIVTAADIDEALAWIEAHRSAP